LSSENYSDWWIEFNHGLKRSIPPRLIRLRDLNEVLEQEIEENGDVDVFTSVYRYPVEDPNVGPVIGGLVFDLDDPSDLENARKEAVKLVNFLRTELEINEKSIDICFSGYKGFSIIINRHVFDFEPDEKLPLIHKSMAREIVEKLGLERVDLVIYERRRLWRLPNTRNSKSGLYKIRLTKQELESLSLDDIKRLAMQPRQWRVEADHQVSSRARAFYLKHSNLVEKQLVEKARSITPPGEYRGEDPPCIQRLLQGVEEGFRNNSAFALSVYFARRGLNMDQLLSRLFGWNERNAPPLEASELEATVRSAFQGVAEDRYSVGCSTEILEMFCDVSRCALVKKGYIPASLREKAEEFLRDPLLLERVLRNQEEVYGAVGNKPLRIACFLACVSTYSAQPLNLNLSHIHGTGGTYNALLASRYFPKEDVWKLGKLSRTALIHEWGDYDEQRRAMLVNMERKILIFVENPELEVLQMLRPLLSHDEHEIMYRTTEKTKSGRLRTFVAFLKGWPAFIFAGARMPVTAEYRTRYLTASPEVSQDRTRLVIQRHAEAFMFPERFQENEETETIRAAMQILRENAPVRVRVPFADRLAKHFDTSISEAMRWFDLFSWLIQASAVLHMFQRAKDPDGYVIADVKDVETAYEAFKAMQQTTIFGLGQHLIGFWEALKNQGSDEYTFDEARIIYSRTFQRGISKRNLKEYWLDPLEAAGLVDIDEDPRDRRRKIIRVLQPSVRALFDYEAFMGEVGYS
jgi:hypothetical protein